jgi:glycosyltransferase involved in cell wall biosynthesis
VRQIGEGLLDDDFHLPAHQSPEFPSRILVIGSGHPLKGWQDMIEACDHLSEREPFSDIILDFTGGRPSGPVFDDLLARSRPYTLNFVGRTDDFAGLVRKYDLVVQPTQCESFGLAGFEVLACGVPLLTTRVGDVVKVLTDENWLCAPNSPDDLAKKLAGICETWGAPPFPAEAVQARIREDFHIAPVCRKIVEQLKEAESRHLEN